MAAGIENMKIRWHHCCALLTAMAVLIFIISIPASLVDASPRVFFISSILFCLILLALGLMDDSVIGLVYLTKLQSAVYISIVCCLLFGFVAIAWGWLVPVGDARVVIAGSASSMVFILAAHHLFSKNLKRIVEYMKKTDGGL